MREGVRPGECNRRWTASPFNEQSHVWTNAISRTKERRARIQDCPSSKFPQRQWTRKTKRLPFVSCIKKEKEKQSTQKINVSSPWQWEIRMPGWPANVGTLNHSAPAWHFYNYTGRCPRCGTRFSQEDGADVQSTVMYQLWLRKSKVALQDMKPMLLSWTSKQKQGRKKKWNISVPWFNKELNFLVDFQRLNVCRCWHL